MPQIANSDSAVPGRNAISKTGHRVHVQGGEPDAEITKRGSMSRLGVSIQHHGAWAIGLLAMLRSFRVATEPCH
jgi:hypothetical protein